MTARTEHTAEFWKAERYDRDSAWQIFDGTTIIATITQGVHDDYAAKVARLMAAAPDLVAALKEMVEQYGGMVDGGVEEPAALAVDHAEAALAKASA